MDQPRQTSILIGIGLVLVGLLGGILMMLFIVDVRPVPVAPRQVERVELGSREPVRPVLVPDSSAPTALDRALSLNRLFKQVADRVTPAVVYIQVESAGYEGLPRDWFHDFDEDTRNRFFRERQPRQSVGSGVIVSEQGYLVTNNHVVEGAADITVTLADKRQYPAQVVGLDPSTDLAVLRIESDAELPVVPLGASDAIEVGEWVIAVGNPFRLTSTVTAGIVSALRRQVNIIEDRFRIEDFIQTDAAINPGNSGGALVNLQGELIGINTAIATESGSYEGYGFAVPVNLMERIVRDLIAYGEVKRGYLGVEIEEINAQRARQLGLAHIGGVYLGLVRPGGAADRAGLEDGDVVISVGDQPVNAPNELQSAVARRRPGDKLLIEVLRRGQQRAFEVELLGRDDPAHEGWFNELAQEEPQGRAPEPETRTPDVEIFEMAEWGIGFRDLDAREQDAFGVAEGVYVAYVQNGSLADEAGLPRDVVILRVGEQEVVSSDDALDAFGQLSRNDEAVLLSVRRRDGITVFYEVDVPPAE
jgi:serine protease Do